MGVLSDLVIAPPGEAERVALADVPSQTFEGIDVKGIDPVKFSMLHSILSRRNMKELSTLYQPVVMVSDEGPWVFEIPPECVTLLGELDDASRSSVARTWAGAQEFELDGWAEDDVASALSAISLLAKKALQSKQALFLWMSL